MSYKSHQKSSSRAFDHLYDISYKSSASNFQKMNNKSLHQSAPLHIIPCYSSMFTDLATKTRNFYFPQRNPLPLNNDVVECSPRMLCDRAVNTNAFILTPKINEREGNFQLEIVSELPRKFMRSIKCQTKYRESSAQTEPWLPDARLGEGEIRVPELMSVECSTSPGLREIEAIERARKRRDWEEALPMISKEEFPLRVAQLEAFEWESHIARERELNENQLDRMEQVVKMIDDRKEIHESISNMKLTTLAEQCSLEAIRKKSQTEISLKRKLRKLKKAKDDVRTSSIKIESTFLDLMKSQSDTNVLFSSSTLPDKPLRSLWKPKKGATEMSKGFRTDKNLKSLYETIVNVNRGKKRGEMRCRTVREGDDGVEKLKCDADDAYLDCLNIQKTIKGRAIEMILASGVGKSADAILNYREKFSIECVCDILPEKYCESLEETSPDCESESFEDLQAPSPEDFEPQIRDFLHKLIKKVVDAVTVVETRRILNEAEVNRTERRFAIQRKAMEKRQREENLRKIDERRQRIANKIMDEILPCVVDIIAESDAREVIQKIAKNVDGEAYTSTETDTGLVKQLLKNFVVPEVERRIMECSENDEELLGLIAAYDTFEFSMENLPLDDIHGGKIICDELIENILSQILRRN